MKTEAQAMRAIERILEGLDEQARARVAAWVVGKYGVRCAPVLPAPAPCPMPHYPPPMPILVVPNTPPPDHGLPWDRFIVTCGGDEYGDTRSGIRVVTRAGDFVQ